VQNGLLCKAHICGGKFTKSRPATVDHVIPVADGGKHEVSNLAAAHASCNSRKKARRENPLTGQGFLL
jgi:5-methylcytosine-specific restriction endonuclease McrA